MSQPETSTPELEWIQMRRDFDADRQGIETTREKFLRKFKSNPLVPVGKCDAAIVCNLSHQKIIYYLGCLATAGALSFGLYSFRHGNEKMSQTMMRARILAQGFTVVALIIGVGFSFSEGLQKK